MDPSTHLPITDRLAIPLAELGWRFSRSSGPGGQAVNTTDSRVQLVFPLATTAALPPALRQRALRRLADRLTDGQLVINASEHRSQWRNRQAAQGRLVALLRQAIAPPAPPRRATRPTRGSVRRRLNAKRRRGDLKAGRRARIGPGDG
jgi:ribosome-associated protein